MDPLYPFWIHFPNDHHKLNANCTHNAHNYKWNAPLPPPPPMPINIYASQCVKINIKTMFVLTVWHDHHQGYVLNLLFDFFFFSFYLKQSVLVFKTCGNVEHGFRSIFGDLGLIFWGHIKIPTCFWIFLSQSAVSLNSRKMPLDWLLCFPTDYPPFGGAGWSNFEFKIYLNLLRFFKHHLSLLLITKVFLVSGYSFELRRFPAPKISDVATPHMMPKSYSVSIRNVFISILRLLK